ncbi:hypothetical protein SERLA73DRAFT_178459 [Serpula lacrymans var. lacrymans S7.3]|uniref:Uncharacterized protein n=2 Tax=Serpula lacrymans var. lacrymans TaxID=341189 RepID=F8PRN4_SERL3|nr:uncharacterized protein SERLADRAFT_462912 [Serpula lacrymans var. lacrymans S7.9]EGO00604.1 hypothetical protein SERLA73DRAFT_178459 [Serpula lacrymans var. lacrymans S7.3]EGO26158.1 hypothetical protein SERLADRAFT_462912 [Serpula lacrymans var. lacrymans S7.9]
MHQGLRNKTCRVHWEGSRMEIIKPTAMMLQGVITLILDRTIMVGLGNDCAMMVLQGRSSSSSSCPSYSSVPSCERSLFLRDAVRNESCTGEDCWGEISAVSPEDSDSL